MFRKWLESRQALRTNRLRNYQFLCRVADAVMDECISLPYATLVDPKGLLTGAEAIVNGVWVDWRSEFTKSVDGTITATIKLHSTLQTPRRKMPALSAAKRPSDAGKTRANLHWFLPIKTIHVDGVQPTLDVPVGDTKEATRSALRQNSQFLDRVAEAVEDEYQSLPYALLADVDKLQAFPEVIANGTSISWSLDVQKSRDGEIDVHLDFHSDLQTNRGWKPSRFFRKRPGDAGAPREILRWVQLNPVVEIAGVEAPPI